MIDIEELNRLLAYDPITGLITWRVSNGPGRPGAGAEAGSIDTTGYRRIKLPGKRYQAHRVAWAIVRGAWPAGQIDHIDGNRANNRLSNLRDVTRSVNCQNQRRAHSHNKSCGLLGVSADLGRWKARIWADGKPRHLGTFDSPEQAHEAYLAAKRRLHEGCTL